MKKRPAAPLVVTRTGRKVFDPMYVSDEHVSRRELEFAERWEHATRPFLSAGWTDPAAFVAAVDRYGIDCKCMATKTMVVSMCFIVMCHENGTAPTIDALRHALRVCGYPTPTRDVHDMVWLTHHAMDLDRFARGVVDLGARARLYHERSRLLEFNIQRIGDTAAEIVEGIRCVA